MVERGELQLPRSKGLDAHRDHTARGDITTWLHSDTFSGEGGLAAAMASFALLRKDIGSILHLRNQEAEFQVCRVLLLFCWCV